MGVVGTLAWLHRRPSFVLADEIRTGAYAGAVSRMMWKSLLGDGSMWGADRGQSPVSGDTQVWPEPPDAILGQFCDRAVRGVKVTRPLPPSAPGW
jgi:hypothetical protein